MRYLLPLSLVALLITGCTATAPTTEEENVPEASTSISIGWEVTEEEPGAYDQPNFSLALVVKGEEEEKIALGKYAGSFADGKTSPVVLVEGTLITGASWWAGAGDEFYVMKTSNTELTVFHRGVEEEVEPGEYSVLKTVKIPAGSEVKVGE